MNEDKDTKPEVCPHCGNGTLWLPDEDGPPTCLMCNRPLDGKGDDHDEGAG